MKEFLRSILTDAEILTLTEDGDVYFLHATNAKAPYVEYEIINEHGQEWAENTEIATNYLVQVDIFSKGDYTNLENKIKEKMLNAGFDRDMSADLYEEDTQLYHKAMRFTYTKNNNI